MNLFLIFAFLFFIGSLWGWVLELFYRRFISAANPERKWINPGFLTGPYLPLYGFSLCALFALAHIKINFIENEIVSKLVLFIVMALVVTCIEFVAGIIFIRKMKIKLWDYDKEWGNIKGVICPKYSLFWAILSAIYYFLIHPNILSSLEWLSRHLTFSFVMGFFYGVFVLDVCYSMNIVAKIRKFADDNEIVVKYEILKETIRERNEELKAKGRFVFAFRSEYISFTDSMKNYLEKEQQKLGLFTESIKDNIKENIIGGYEKLKDNIGNAKDNFKENISINKNKTDDDDNKTDKD